MSCKTEGTSFLTSFILNVSVCRMAYFNGSEVACLFKNLHLEESSDLVHAKIIFCFHALSVKLSITNSYTYCLSGGTHSYPIWYLTQPLVFPSSSLACRAKCLYFQILKKQFVFIYLYIFHNHLNAEPGVAIEVRPQGTGMQNAHSSMVFWSKVLEDNFFFPPTPFFPPKSNYSIVIINLSSF